MEIIETGIEGLVQVQPKVHNDHRGWFYEIFKASSFSKISNNFSFLQDNISSSKKDVLRGLHLQVEPFGQAKFVTVLSGKVLDVVVDVRRGSKTFGKTYQIILDGNLKNMLFVPDGFAHGFRALEDSIFLYKCSKEYNPATESGILWNDPDLKIDWGIQNPIISDKDLILPTFQELLKKSVISRQ